MTYEDEVNRWKIIKQYFETHLIWIEEFALEHNLYIEKYYHEFPEWALRFKHKKGGSGQIELVYTGKNNEIEIWSSWHIDEYTEFTRYLKWGIKRLVSDEQDKLREEILKEIQTVLHWNKSEMIAHRDYATIWGRYSKEEFNKIKENSDANLLYFKE